MESKQHTHGYATNGPKEDLKPFEFERRTVGSKDVLIEIAYCGVCHSDIHMARNEWGITQYPLVPGHEIVGKVTKVGDGVKRFKVGDTVGVGCLVDSCRECDTCKNHQENLCLKGNTQTYGSVEKDGKSTTRGGYSNQIVVTEDFVLNVSPDLPLEKVAPLLCAGITTYSPMMKFGVKKGQKVGVVGLGGLGHMGVKIAHAIGAEVTVFSTTPNKERDARELGADHFVATKDPENLKPHQGKFDFILDTVSANHDINQYINLLKVDGTICLVGAPEHPLPVKAFGLIFGARRLAGSLIGGLKETQEMLDFCAKHKVFSEVEVIPIQKINEAFERTLKSDVRYRFVIDMKSLNTKA